MQSGYNQNMNEKTYSILESILSSCGDQINRDQFKKEIENLNDEKDLVNISKHFVKSIKYITSQDVKDHMGPMMARVKRVNDNGTIDVVPLQQKKDDECWTEVPNPTLFQYLESGDVVILGFAKTSQKSNCWVEMVVLDNFQDFKNKTIFKHLDKLSKIQENIDFLNEWLNIIKYGG